MYRFLLTRRWLAFHLLVLALIPAFFFLGQWQFGRFEERSASSERTTANLNSAPVPLDQLDTIGGTVPDAMKYRPVTMTGTYDTSHELLVRRRPQNGQVGFYVVTPLVTPQGAVLVNRGWVPAGATAESRPEVPAPPSGEVTVTGRLKPSETENTTGIRNRTSGLPTGQVLLVNTTDIGATLPYRLYGGFVELTAQRPTRDPAPEPVPAPDVGGGGGLNLAYSVQWWLFIGVAVGGWFLLIRREARDLSAAGEDGEESGKDQQEVRAQS
ncbi:SURF1 family protein [Microtetraspora sp. NBRC 16547]|uniref:SURF1 family cytochrome oxidase biogenesis protein n=1 Tax=Microtetraspora sp. NBRC 16547 TaxID=3030993 RepID=UPI0024A37748|nr:SURF1 family protein [Microtetraspora sp. NBRC 16547]GLX01098.1 SURF1-like protein [Microtetraspora sp. NBRC 16547]